jgi:DNA-binding NarL/FixJ family response regulator
MISEDPSAEKRRAGPRRKRSRVLIVDDHPIVRRGLAQLIAQEAGLEVCGEAESAPEAMAEVCRAKPDLILLDVSIEGMNGIELTKVIREKHPELPVLVLSMHEESVYAERAIRAGARGYVTKQEAPQTVLRAMHRVLQGDLYVSETMAGRMLEDLLDEGPGVDKPIGLRRLSDRELGILGWIGRGLSTRDIAEKLGRSVKTVETHIARIKKKLRLKTRAEVARYAVLWTEGSNENPCPPPGRQ